MKFHRFKRGPWDYSPRYKISAITESCLCKYFSVWVPDKPVGWIFSYRQVVHGDSLLGNRISTNWEIIPTIDY